MKHNILKIMVGAALSLLLVGTVSASAIEYGWPTDNHRITQYFKLYATSTSKKHWGLDIGVNGENVYASADGEVYEVYTGCANNNGAKQKSCELAGKCAPSAEGNCNPKSKYLNGFCNDGFGNGIIIRHNDGSYSSYAHLKSVNVKFGDRVSKGDVIGVSGSAGYSYGAHLHFTVVESTKLGYWGAYNSGHAINPLPLINRQTSNDNEDDRGDEGTNAKVKTTNADTITETSAILRGSFTTTGERATECGMYLGTHQNSLTKLGSDSVNTYGTSMFYSTAKYGRTLTPGTTYYYQAYVIVNGSETKGSVESFITKGTPPTPTPALGISLSSDSLTLKYGTCNKLSASTTPAALPVTWKSSDESVVTVKDGVVTAIGSGTAYVVAIVYGDKKSASDFCTVTVEAPSATEPAPVAPVDPDIKLVQSTATLDIGERTTLQAITTPADQTVGWNSSNEAVAVVDQSGIVTALAAGTATITACMEYNGDTYFALCGIAVKSTAPDVTLSVSSVTNIAQTTARVNASCAYGAGCRPSSVGLYLGTSPSSLSYWKSDDGITHNKNPFDIWYNLSDLSAGTTYYYQFYAKTDRGEVRSEVNSFTTESLNLASSTGNTRVAVVVNTNGQYLAINDAPAASPHYSNQIGRIPPIGAVIVDLSKSSGNWYYVEYNGVNGYAYSKYLSLR